LLTHDPEFTATGAETKINYQADYDFYLQHLFKRTPWASSVMNYFNKEVFDLDSQPQAASDLLPATAAQPRTWEDDLLDELDAPLPISTPPTSTTSAMNPQALGSPSLSTSSATVDSNSDLVANFDYNTTISISKSQSATSMVSTSASLQLGVNRLSLDDAAAETFESVSVAPGRSSVPSRQTQLATEEVKSAMPVPRQAEPSKRVTRNGGNNTGQTTMRSGKTRTAAGRR